MPSLYPFNLADIVQDTQKIATSTWSNNTNNLTSSFTSSVQADFSSPTSSGAFFLDIYNSPTSSTAGEVQYSIAYGHVNGSGSLNFTNDVGAKGKSASGATYAQYRNLVFGDDTISNFSFDGFTPDDIYIINVRRSRYRNGLKPGTLNLHLSGANTGGAGLTVHLTDDSVSSTGSSTLTNLGRQFNIVSGANGIRSGSTLTPAGINFMGLTPTTTSGSYGHFYPDSGIMILNALALSQSGVIISQSADQLGDNVNPTGMLELHHAISRSSYFIVDSEEKISSQYFFTRVKNSEFNYSSNPSYIDTNGNLNNATMADSPTTYITTVGLYNDDNNLIAVAKLSQPLKKDFTTETLIRVKLDY